MAMRPTLEPWEFRGGCGSNGSMSENATGLAYAPKVGELTVWCGAAPRFKIALPRYLEPARQTSAYGVS
jgi:hypothetical protein